MPIFGYACTCGSQVDVIRTFDDNSPQICAGCQQAMTRQLSAPHFKFAGVAAKGGGPDRFTADALGMDVKDLPSGLRTMT